MAKHLHEQAGGNPSQSAKGKMANPKPSAGAGNDFPDVPPANAEGGVQDDRDDEETDDDTDPSTD